MKKFSVLSMIVLLFVTSFGSVFAQDEPEFSESVVFKRVTAQAVLRDASSSTATQLTTVLSGDRVEILASDGNYFLVNVYTLVNQSASTFEYGGFGWISSNADLVSVASPNILQQECPLDSGGTQAHLTSFVEFGDGWAWSISSAQGCNILAEGRPLDSTNDTHHYWAVRDLHQSAGTGQYSDDAQVTRYVENNVVTAIEGTVWLYPVNWNMSHINEDKDDQPIFLEFAKQKRIANAEYPIVVHDLRGRTIGVTESMLDGVVPESPDSFDELTPISVTGNRADDGEVIASVGSNDMCWLFIGQADEDEALEVERHCGMDEGFSFYPTNNQPSFFWVLPDSSTLSEAADMAIPEAASYTAEFFGVGVSVDVHASGFGSNFVSGDYSVSFGD